MSSYPSINTFLNLDLLADLQKSCIITTTFFRLEPSRRESIVNSILEEAALKGPALINIKEVARRAGVSVGSLYQYFNHRQGLIDFAIEITTRQMVAAFTHFKPYLTGMPLFDALRAYLRGADEMDKEYQGYIRYFTRAAYQGEPALTERIVRPIAQVMLDMTRSILIAAQSRGEIRTDIDLEAMARLVNSLVIAVYDAQLLPHLNTYYQLTDENMARERILDNLMAFIESALKG